MTDPCRWPSCFDVTEGQHIPRYYRVPGCGMLIGFPRRADGQLIIQIEHHGVVDQERTERLAEQLTGYYLTPALIRRIGRWIQNGCEGRL